MIADRPLLGIALMTGFCLLAPIGDSMAKVLGDSLPLAQVVAARFGFQVLLLLPVVLLTGRTLTMTRAQYGLTAVRTILHIFGIGAMFLSLRYLPLADALAIAFVMPFIMLLLGWAFMGEEVGIRRLGACAVGFVGTLLVIQPSFAAVGLPALLPLFVAVVFALFMMVTRQMAKDVDALSLQTVSGAMASVILLPLLWLADGTGWAEIDPVAPDGFQWRILVAMGVLGTLAHLLMTWSLRFAPASTLAPMQYLEIPFATVVGYIVFGDFPNGLALAGIAVTMAAGLYIVFRERALSRTPAAPAPQSQPPALTGGG
ncbi:MAG: DMT family transporter [Paracoccaceae bacterium]